MKRLFTLGLFVCLFLPAGEPDHGYTGPWLNCRGWRGMASAHKLGYVMGFRDGLLAGMAALSTSTISTDPQAEPILKTFLPDRFSTNAEQQSGVEAICASAENAAIAVPWAFDIFALKANGRPVSEVEKKVSDYRQIASMMEAKAAK